MNERIRELAVKSGIAYQSKQQDHDTNDGFTVISSKDSLEKFAELIVRECIDIAGKEDFDVMMKEGYPCSQTAKKIKEHFGVE